MADARNLRHLTQNIRVGILALGDAEVLSFALGDAKVPDARYFAFWWNIGFKGFCQMKTGPNSHPSFHVIFVGYIHAHVAW